MAGGILGRPRSPFAHGIGGAAQTTRVVQAILRATSEESPSASKRMAMSMLSATRSTPRLVARIDWDQVPTYVARTHALRSAETLRLMRQLVSAVADPARRVIGLGGFRRTAS